MRTPDVLVTSVLNLYKFVLVKDTCYLCGKNNKNPQLLDILACNSANKMVY